MPIQIVDLRSFLRESLGFDDNVDRRTIAASTLQADGVDILNIESTQDIQEQDTVNASGKYYTLVGHNKVGDGSVVGP